MRLPKYLWTREGDTVVLHENSTVFPYDRRGLEATLADIKAANRPPDKCGYLFERRRALNIKKIQEGLDLLNNQ